MNNVAYYRPQIIICKTFSLAINQNLSDSVLLRYSLGLNKKYQRKDKKRIKKGNESVYFNILIYSTQNEITSSRTNTFHPFLNNNSIIPSHHNNNKRSSVT